MALIVLVGGFAEPVVEAVFLHFAIKRRSADAELARHGGHLAAIIRQRESDRFGFELIERPHRAVFVEERQDIGVAHFDADDLAFRLAVARSLWHGRNAHVEALDVAGDLRKLGDSEFVAVSEDHGAGVSGEVDGRAVRVGTASHAGSPAAAGPPPGEAGSLTAHVSVDGRPAGVLILADPIRPVDASTLEALRRAGLTRIVLVTGDREEVARAATAGLPIDRIVAGVSPAGKVDAVREESGNVVRSVARTLPK